jgi:predicted PurR-regulated permease PerM
MSPACWPGSSRLNLFYASISLPRTNAILLFGILTAAALYVGRLFFMPLAFGALLAMLLRPVSNWLERRAWAGRGRRPLPGARAGVHGAGWLGLWACKAPTLPRLAAAQATAFEELDRVQQQVAERFGVAPQKQVLVLREQLGKVSDSLGRFVSATLKGLLGTVGGFVLVLLYLFFLLWQRSKFRNFILKLRAGEPERNRDHARPNQQSGWAVPHWAPDVDGVHRRRVRHRHFIIGLKNALLLSIIAVLPTIVPYVGAYIGAAFPLAMALAGARAGTVLPTVGVIMLAQFIDNNIVEPIAMGSALHLSPFFTIMPWCWASCYGAFPA